MPLAICLQAKLTPTANESLNTKLHNGSLSLNWAVQSLGLCMSLWICVISESKHHQVHYSSGFLCWKPWLCISYSPLGYKWTRNGPTDRDIHVCHWLFIPVAINIPLCLSVWFNNFAFAISLLIMVFREPLAWVIICGNIVVALSERRKEVWKCCLNGSRWMNKPVFAVWNWQDWWMTTIRSQAVRFEFQSVLLKTWCKGQEKKLNTPSCYLMQTQKRISIYCGWAWWEFMLHSQIAGRTQFQNLVSRIELCCLQRE